jgi:hypothetical protein
MDAREVQPIYTKPIPGVLPELLHSLSFVDWMLMTIATFPREGI